MGARIKPPPKTQQPATKRRFPRQRVFSSRLSDQQADRIAARKNSAWGVKGRHRKFWG
jgi:hypothetical protein